MDDEQFDDLKQFIVTTVGQTEARLTERMDGLDGRMDGLDGRMAGLEGRMAGLEGRMDTLEQKMDDGFAGVGEAIEQIHQRIDAHEADTNTRLTRLEQKAA